jgi:hypothetical protein
VRDLTMVSVFLRLVSLVRPPVLPLASWVLPPARVDCTVRVVPLAIGVGRR